MSNTKFITFAAAGLDLERNSAALVRLTAAYRHPGGALGGEGCGNTGAAALCPAGDDEVLAQFIIVNTRFLVFDIKLLVFDTEFLVLNAKFIIFAHLPSDALAAGGGALGRVGLAVEQGSGIVELWALLFPVITSDISEGLPGISPGNLEGRGRGLFVSSRRTTSAGGRAGLLCRGGGGGGGRPLGGGRLHGMLRRLGRGLVVLPSAPPRPAPLRHVPGDLTRGGGRGEDLGLDLGVLPERGAAPLRLREGDSRLGDVHHAVTLRHPHDPLRHGGPFFASATGYGLVLGSGVTIVLGSATFHSSSSSVCGMYFFAFKTRRLFHFSIHNLTITGILH